MEFTEKDLDNLSALARITIKDEEKPKMLADMQAILGYVSELDNVAGEREFIKDAHYNVTRDDHVTHDPGMCTEVLLKEAPAVEDNYVKVAQVLK